MVMNDPRQVSHDDQIVKIRSAYKNLCQANEFVVVEGTVRVTPCYMFFIEHGDQFLIIAHRS